MPINYEQIGFLDNNEVIVGTTPTNEPVKKTLDADNVTYTPDNASNWSIVPTALFEALDEMAQRVTNLDGGVDIKPEFARSLSVSSTTLQTFQDKINYTTTQSLPPGNYKVNWTLEWTTNNNNKNIAIEISIDGVVFHTGNHRPSYANEYSLATSFFYASLTGTTIRNLIIKYRCVDNSMTAFIKETRIDIQPFGGV